jgi:hypothetical protein
MIILRIEHKVENFDGWKKVFDSDPINRKQSGVRRYRICRPTDDQNQVIVDLEFDGIDKAEAAFVALRKIWSRVEGKVMFNPQVRIVEIAESKEY